MPRDDVGIIAGGTEPSFEGQVGEGTDDNSTASLNAQIDEILASKVTTWESWTDIPYDTLNQIILAYNNGELLSFEDFLEWVKNQLQQDSLRHERLPLGQQGDDQQQGQRVYTFESITLYSCPSFSCDAPIQLGAGGFVSILGYTIVQPSRTIWYQVIGGWWILGTILEGSTDEELDTFALPFIPPPQAAFEDGITAITEAGEVQILTYTFFDSHIYYLIGDEWVPETDPRLAGLSVHLIRQLEFFPDDQAFANFLQSVGIDADIVSGLSSEELLRLQDLAELMHIYGFRVADLDAQNLGEALTLVAGLEAHGIMLSSTSRTNAGGKPWEVQNIRDVFDAVNISANSVEALLEDIFGVDFSQDVAFRLVFGPTKINRVGSSNISDADNQNADINLGDPVFKHPREVEVGLTPVRLIIHELAHNINYQNRVNYQLQEGTKRYVHTGRFGEPELFTDFFYSELGLGNSEFRFQAGSGDPYEVVTDAYANLLAGTYDNTEEGQQARRQTEELLRAAVLYRLVQIANNEGNATDIMPFEGVGGAGENLARMSEVQLAPIIELFGQRNYEAAANLLRHTGFFIQPLDVD